MRALEEEEIDETTIRIKIAKLEVDGFTCKLFDIEDQAQGNQFRKLQAKLAANDCASGAVIHPTDFEGEMKDTERLIVWKEKTANR